MKKSWIVAGLTMGAVVAVGVFVLTTKDANDTKNAGKQTIESTAKQGEIISGTEIMTEGNDSYTKYTNVGNAVILFSCGSCISWSKQYELS